MYPPDVPPDDNPLGSNVDWCRECGRYYNPEQPHECRDKEVTANRRTLEHWLVRYTIREEG